MKEGYFFMILCMGLVTYLPRCIPLVLLSRRKVPMWFDMWLDMIPPAILSALLFPALLTSGVPTRLDFWNPALIAAAPTFLFAWKTRSLGGSVIVGMIAYWLIGQWFPAGG